ncbi:hypothetical protein K437DRAFT_16494 [Tilletiaria anomala UBC 951]|uniref:Uncharacterized protein n=1 Tax=Tilletiaria anomala (strain ATCC 24038 / CBS 436.72 / UBC 951) TaxID=1037660 RepID=A0A066WMZ9_TILAU|nr:uncharacterized protein K437DRAFT_16494 [Tilletiaria anomala UBC 951]KDN52339.1 hypothetical protein K437DRAFT_16494 [Tilletiaria anomala UBC 951]
MRMQPAPNPLYTLEPAWRRNLQVWRQAQAAALVVVSIALAISAQRKARGSSLTESPVQSARAHTNTCCGANKRSRTSFGKRAERAHCAPLLLTAVPAGVR